MENIKEKSEKRICKYWLQIESCRKCLFEALCNYEDNRDRNEGKEVKERFINNKK